MRHTELTPRNYADFTSTIFLMGLVIVGFGAVDLIMVAPTGTEHVAAVGQGEIIFSGLTALLSIGVVDTFSGRLAVAEGRGETTERLPALVGALVLLIVVCQVVAVLPILGLETALRLAGQDPSLIPLVGDYVAVRAGTIGLLIIYAASNEALKICGKKNQAFGVLVAGVGVNVGLNWLFLYSGVVNFPSPESAVATATIAAQTVVALCTVSLFISAMRGRGGPLGRPARPAVTAEFTSMLRTAPGIGVRHFNDYAGTIIVTTLIGTLGTAELAACVVAAKIWSLYCRVPQACVSGTFVFYGYELGRSSDGDVLRRTARTLLRYATVPTAGVAVLVAAGAPVAVAAFTTPEMDRGLTQALLLAFLISVPAYLLQHSFGEILTIHQRGTLLATASTVVTYGITIPFAALAVFVLKSPFLAVTSYAVSSVVIALVFWRAVRTHHRDMEVAIA